VACVVTPMTESLMVSKTHAAAARHTQHVSAPFTRRGQLAPGIGDGRLPVRIECPRSAAVLVLSKLASLGGPMLHWACRLLGMVCCTATASIASIVGPAGNAAPPQSHRDGAAAPLTSRASDDDTAAVSQSSSASTAASILTRSRRTNQAHRHGGSMRGGAQQGHPRVLSAPLIREVAEEEVL